MEKFLQANQNIPLTINSKKDKYDFIRKTLLKFNYNNLKKKEKGIIICYLIHQQSTQTLKKKIDKRKEKERTKIKRKKDWRYLLFIKK